MLSEMPTSLAPFWKYKDGLYEVDGVVMYDGRVVIPTSLRDEVSTLLHQAHRGTTQMGNRAVHDVF